MELQQSPALTLSPFTLFLQIHYVELGPKITYLHMENVGAFHGTIKLHLQEENKKVINYRSNIEGSAHFLHYHRVNEIVLQVIYNPITVMGFFTMFTFQLQIILRGKHCRCLFAVMGVHLGQLMIIMKKKNHVCFNSFQISFIDFNNFHAKHAK